MPLNNPPPVDAKIAAAIADLKYVKVGSGVVKYNDISPVTLITLPAGSVVIAFLVNITTAFLGTNPNVKFGDAADDDGFITAINAVGWYGVSQYGLYLPEQKSYAVATDVIATLLGTGLTAGEATAYIIYAEGS